MITCEVNGERELFIRTSSERIEKMNFQNASNRS